MFPPIVNNEAPVNSTPAGGAAEFVGGMAKDDDESAG
jgi:hypothetical protein